MTPQAITGVAVRLPGCTGIDQLESALYAGRRPDAAAGEVGAATASDLARRLAEEACADAGIGYGGAVAVLVAARAEVDAASLIGHERIDLALPASDVLEAAAHLVMNSQDCAVLVLVDRAERSWYGVALVLSSRGGPPAYAVVEDMAGGVTPPAVPHIRPVASVGALGWAVAVAQVAICLRSSFLPAPPPQPGRAASAPAPWLHSSGRRRRALVRALRPSGEEDVVFLAEPVAPRVDVRAFVPRGPLVLVPLIADNPGDLVAAVDQVEADLHASAPPAEVADRGVAHARAARGGQLRLSLVGSTADELLAEITAARRAVDSALGRSADWMTPRGSCLTAGHGAGTRPVAFAYPGAFSAYPRLAAGVFQLLPSTLAGMGDVTSDPETVFAVDELTPPFTSAPSAGELAAMEAGLAHNPLAVLSASMAYSVLYTRALRRVFGIEPSVGFGYSLGESSMLLALGVWRDGDALRRAVQQSPLFRNRLSGRMEAVREHWAEHGHVPRRHDAPWATYVLLAEPEVVDAHITEPTRVFASIVNGPKEVVVAGDPDACVDLARRIGCEHLPLPFPQALHAPPVERELAEFARLNRHPASPVDGITFFSATSPAPLVLEEDELAARLATMACARLDFAALVERVYAAGVRVFVEVGPGTMLSRLIGSILKGRDHAAVSVDRRGVDAHTSLIRLLARLHAAGVPVDLRPLQARRPAFVS